MQTLPLGLAPVSIPEDTGSISVTLPAGAVVGQVVARVQFRNGYRPFLTFIGNAVAAALAGVITWRVKCDGTLMLPYFDTLGQWAPPESPDREITPYRELPQNAVLTIECDATAASPGGLVTARIMGIYAAVQGGS